LYPISISMLAGDSRNSIRRKSQDGAAVAGGLSALQRVLDLPSSPPSIAISDYFTTGSPLISKCGNAVMASIKPTSVIVSADYPGRTLRKSIPCHCNLKTGQSSHGVGAKFQPVPS